jgi:ABC-type phosphate/phosphonate transport system permease subunit
MTSMTSRDSAQKPKLLESRRVLTLILLAAFIWSLLNLDWTSGFIHSGGISAMGEFASALFSLDLSTDTLTTAISASWTTVAYAVAGLTLALLIGIPLGAIGSGVLTKSSWVKVSSTGVTRFTLAVCSCYRPIANSGSTGPGHPLRRHSWPHLCRTTARRARGSFAVTTQHRRL